jgi:CheY-like chemotaxis protein
MKILIVDDDPAMLLVVSMALEQVGGFEVIQARGGLEAIECALQKQPDAILMDLVMQDVDGSIVLEKLRAHESTDKIPVIIHTAKTDPSEMRDLIALGAKGVIVKPMNPVRLAGEISRILAS